MTLKRRENYNSEDYNIEMDSKNFYYQQPKPFINPKAEAV